MKPFFLKKIILLLKLIIIIRINVLILKNITLKVSQYFGTNKSCARID